MDDELRSHLTRFYRFAYEFVRVSGDLSKMQEFLARDDIEFSILPDHVAKLRNLDCDGRALWELSSLIFDAMLGVEIPPLDLRKARHQAYLELYLFDKSTVGESDELKDSQREILLTITEAGRRLTTTEVQRELALKQRLWGESTVKNELRNLVVLGRLDNRRTGSPRGYGLKQWS